MKALNCTTSACRHCRHFTPEGRRGGHCQQLGVLVRGSWKACSLAMPAFAPSWEGLEGIVLWPANGLNDREVLPLECCTIGCSDLNTPEHPIHEPEPEKTPTGRTLQHLKILV
ncbi:MAG: hypothetical protein LRZ84_05650 [Desertifilum sp.]|nr:hypothetical protein [Desertifilum sp.]MDI9640611.1 hypothetical protein [Geitlerinema splendidum]